MIARGRSINVTLIFSLQRYVEVVEAYLRGLERLVESGGDPGRVASVASFFVSRVDTEADKRLDEARRARRAEGQARGRQREARLPALQGALLGRALGGARAPRARRPQRCLWASTSTKNPAYRDVLYVEELIGPETVNTMPEETIEAFQDHGEVALTLERDVDEAKRVFERLAEAGVDYDDVVATLEQRGRGEVLRLVLGAARRRSRPSAASSSRPEARGSWRSTRRSPAKGPALVLVHEGICDSRMWDEQWERYAESFRVLRLDLRGFGRTPLEPGPFAHARDVIETLERQRLRPGGSDRRVARRPSRARGRARTSRARLRARPGRAGHARTRVVGGAAPAVGEGGSRVRGRRPRRGGRGEPADVGRRAAAQP